jgi:ABC-type uncharacterized transport system ATPase subunit
VADSVVPGSRCWSTWRSADGPCRRGVSGSTGDRSCAGRTTTTPALGLRIAASSRRLEELSGGNIQRVVLTRELALDASLLVAAYPSRGLDIANVRRTQELLLERREAGAGVLVVSEDVDELMSLATGSS